MKHKNKLHFDGNSMVVVDAWDPGTSHEIFSDFMFGNKDLGLNTAPAILSLLNAGIWMLNMTSSSLLVCSRCKEIIPVFREKSVKISSICDLISLGFGQKAMDAFLMAGRIGNSFDLEVPIVAINDSPPCWLRITGRAVFNDQKVMFGLYGMLEDISQRKNEEILKQDFLAMVSHDLRSPLSVIKLCLQMTGRIIGSPGNYDVADLLERASLQADKMNRMIQCFLESTAIESGKIAISPTSFEISALLNEVIRDIYLLNPNCIIFLKPGPLIHLNADRDKIAQVLQNLLTNAIKYSSRADVIVVHYKKTGDKLRIAVKDHGIGIKPAYQAKIFDRFYRVKGESDTMVTGYGIGLYLCREIINQHKGDIWLKSKENEGSTFYFTMPLS